MSRRHDGALNTLDDLNEPHMTSTNSLNSPSTAAKVSLAVRWPVQQPARRLVCAFALVFGLSAGCAVADSGGEDESPRRDENSRPAVDAATGDGLDAGVAEDAFPLGDTGGQDAGEGEADTTATDTGPPSSDTADAGGGTTDSGPSDTGTSDTTPTDAGADTVADAPIDTGDEPCISEVFEPGAIVRPVDIIWAIDASPSMDDEITRIEAQLNDFATRIGGSGLDYRVVLIGSDRDQYIPAEAHRFNEICIPPPLSAAATCPDVDSDRFLHVREPIHSRAVLLESIETFPQYRDFLRADAIKHFIYVTDDDERSASTVTAFENLVANEPVMGDFVYVHSIVDFIGYDPNCFLDDNCSCGDARGEQYLGLSDSTGGIAASICEDDWTPIFEALEEVVTGAVEVPCEFIVPDPGDEFEVDYRQVGVRSTGAGARELGRVESAGACGAEGGWYFDDPASPTRLLLCPTSCGDTGGGLEVELACFRPKV
jgi:hypothetical protein